MKRIVRNTAARVLAACTTFLLASAAGAATDVTWTGTPLTASSTSIRTDGTLKYAYARENYTVNGVAFTGVGNGIVNTGNCVVWEATMSVQTLPPTAPFDTEEGGYKNLLQHAWWTTARDRKIQLNNLESGKQYLVQIISFRNDGSSHTATAPDNGPTIHFGGTDWEYGGSLIGIFTADGASETFTIGYSGSACINGIQVRELDGSSGGGGDEPTVVDPSIGSASVSVSGSTATVSLGGIVLGTDAQGTAATCYDVSYSLTNAASVTALSNQSGATASFDIANLADGGYACAVTVATDGSQSVSTNLSFTVGGAVPAASWTSGPMSSTGDTIRTDGTLLYAYAVRNVTVGGVTFAATNSFGAPVMVSASPSPTGYVLSDFQNEGVSGGFGGMLESGWHWGQNGDPAAELVVTLTLTGLTAGNTYLVQLVSHRHSNSTLVSAEGSTPVHIYGTHDGVTYTYGGSIVGVFTATGPTKDVVVTYSETSSGPRPLNAIQVREIAVGPSSTPLIIAIE